MLKPGTECFFHLSQKAGKRVLHPANVLEHVGANTYTVMLEQDNVTAEPGQSVVVYYEHRQEFMQQQARITERVTTEPPIMIRFETVGKPVSAEQRQWYRVATVMTGLTTNFGDETGCSLVDISATGLAVIAARNHAYGEIIPVRTIFEGVKYSGFCSVKSLRTLGPGRIRYGLLCLDDPSLCGNLQKGLRAIFMAVQRQHLRHLAGAGV